MARILPMVDYRDMVSTLSKDGGEILKTITPEKAHIIHMSLGLAGETGELVEAVSNYLEDPSGSNLGIIIGEMGDLEFYLEGLRTALDIEISSFATTTSFDSVRYNYNISIFDVSRSLIGLVPESCRAVDEIKKHISYDRDLNLGVVIDSIDRFELELNCLRCRLGIDRSDVLKDNIDKLSKRYKGLKYSDQAANNRVDVTS